MEVFNGLKRVVRDVNKWLVVVKSFWVIVAGCFCCITKEGCVA